MKDQIIKLIEMSYAEAQLEAQKPMVETISYPIEDIKPSELSAFMQEHGIPDHAYFTCEENEMFIEYKIEIPKTARKISEHLIEMFYSNAYQRVHEYFTSLDVRKRPKRFTEWNSDSKFRYDYEDALEAGDFDKFIEKYFPLNC